VREYDLIAEWYACERVDETGVSETTTLAFSIPYGSRVLDIGCGNGIPITRALLRGGHLGTGLDSSGAMIERLRDNCPEAVAVQGLAQACPFADRIFDAAVAWGVMFHLNPEDQIKAIAAISRVLKARGTFLFTSGDIDEFEGKDDTLNCIMFRYSFENYRRILHDHGLTLIDVHSDKGDNTYYLATKKV
jgi:ubiquinone/menaquinone biosynthesis C-methylase UbiE